MVLEDQKAFEVAFFAVVGGFFFFLLNAVKGKALAQAGLKGHLLICSFCK